MIVRFIMIGMDLTARKDLPRPEHGFLLPGERESLQGLAGVEVVIEEITPDAQKNGLSEEAIQIAVELILRSSGIRVLTPSERMEIPGRPYLYVNVNTVKSGSIYAYHVSLEVTQQVWLVHKPQHKTLAPTWREQFSGLISENILRSIIADAIEPKVKAFANDFLTVNPR